MPRNDGVFLPYCCAYHELCVRTRKTTLSQKECKHVKRLEDLLNDIKKRNHLARITNISSGMKQHTATNYGKTVGDVKRTTILSRNLRTYMPNIGNGKLKLNTKDRATFSK